MTSTGHGDHTRPCQWSRHIPKLMCLATVDKKTRPQHHLSASAGIHGQARKCTKELGWVVQATNTSLFSCLYIKIFYIHTNTYYILHALHKSPIMHYIVYDKNASHTWNKHKINILLQSGNDALHSVLHTYVITKINVCIERYICLALAWQLTRK